jgi:aspartyl protease family protein
MEKDWGHLAYEIIIVLVVSSAIASGKIRKNLKYLLIWAAIFIVFIAGYSYRFELAGIRERVMMELVPSKGFQEKPGSISFPVSSDGHFYIRAEVNGIPILFLADTGASSIVLSKEDAKRVGINLNDLIYNRFY